MFTININNVEEGAASTGAVAKRDGSIGPSCNTTINPTETQPQSKNSTSVLQPQKSFLGKAVNKTTTQPLL